MALDLQRIRLTDDHTLETASEVMSHLQFDRRLPNGRQSYLKLLKDLGLRSNQDGEEHTQYVLQGQCLILGDARVGKTSLQKSLVGKPFNTKEPKTKGVDISLVDRQWRNLDSDAGLTFGSFGRFGKTVLCKGAMYGPGGIEFTFNQEVTTVTSFLYALMRITWVISIIWYLASCTASTKTVRAISFVTDISLAITLHFINSTHPGGSKIAVLFVMLPLFIVGLGTIFIITGILRGINCNNSEYSFSKILGMSGSQFFLVPMMCNRISICVLFFMSFYFDVFKTWSEESSLPGQTKLNTNSTSIIIIVRRLYILIYPVIVGADCGAMIIEELTNMSTWQYCQTLHLIMVPICLIVIFRLTQTLCAWVSNNYWKGLIFFLYVIVQKSAVSLSLFHLYIAMFAAWACYTLFTDWDDILFPLNDSKKRQASFTFVFIEKVALNFQKLKSALSGQFSSLKLKFLDFSGDEEYYAYHHIFMRDHALYIVVFNMANFVDNNFGNIGAKIQRLCFWLESICSKTAPKTQIFLVGTHRGNMDKSCLQRIDKHLKRHLLPSFIDELVMNKEDNLLYFPTENMLGRKDRGIQNLQNEIMSTAEEHKTTMGREIPYSWIKIQDAIINLRRDKNAKFCLTTWTKIKYAIKNLWQNKKAKCCVTLQQFPLSLGVICTNWSKETLKYFHEKGLVFYADQSHVSELSNWILLDPDVLVEIIVQLVTPRTDEEVLSQHVFRSDWKLLHDTGMLSESLLENILSRLPENGKAIKGFMEEYDIICPLFFNAKKKEEEAQVTHFVPSLLPMSDVITPVWLDGPDDKKFYVFFHRFLPEALFQHLLSQAHKNSRAEFAMGQPVICKDVGRFWMRPSQPYRLLQLKDEYMIEVTFNYRDPGHEMKPSDALVYIYGMISGICKQHFPYVKFHCGPLCPSDRCPGYQGDYVPHPGVQRVCSRCHVFNVMPARQEAMVASFYCVNQNFKEQLMEWVV